MVDVYCFSYLNICPLIFLPQYLSFDFPLYKPVKVRTRFLVSLLTEQGSMCLFWLESKSFSAKLSDLGQGRKWHEMQYLLWLPILTLVQEHQCTVPYYKGSPYTHMPAWHRTGPLLVISTQGSDQRALRIVMLCRASIPTENLGPRGRGHQSQT